MHARGGAGRGREPVGFGWYEPAKRGSALRRVSTAGPATNVGQAARSSPRWQQLTQKLYKENGPSSNASAVRSTSKKIKIERIRPVLEARPRPLPLPPTQRPWRSAQPSASWRSPAPALVAVVPRPLPLPPRRHPLLLRPRSRARGARVSTPSAATTTRQGLSSTAACGTCFRTAAPAASGLTTAARTSCAGSCSRCVAGRALRCAHPLARPAGTTPPHRAPTLHRTLSPATGHGRLLAATSPSRHLPAA